MLKLSDRQKQIQCNAKKKVEYLNLPNPNVYTGRSFRRTPATLLANSEADLMMLKHHGRLKSSTVVEGYVQDSITSKRRIGQMITSSISVDPFTSNEITESNVRIDNIKTNRVFNIHKSTVNINCHYH